MKLKRDLEQVQGENGRLIESFEHVKTEYFNYRQTAERLMAQVSLRFCIIRCESRNFEKEARIQLTKSRPYPQTPSK